MELDKILHDYSIIKLQPFDDKHCLVESLPGRRLVNNATTMWLRHEPLHQLKNSYAVPTIHQSTIGAFTATLRSPGGDYTHDDVHLTYLIEKRSINDEFYINHLKNDPSVISYVPFSDGDKNFILFTIILDSYNLHAKKSVLNNKPYDAYSTKIWERIAMYSPLAREAAYYALMRSDPDLHKWINRITYPQWLKYEQEPLKSRIAERTAISAKYLADSSKPIILDDETLVFRFPLYNETVNQVGKIALADQKAS